jgi:biotin synthase
MQATQTIEKPLTQVKSQKDLHKEVNATAAWSVPQIEALFALPFSELMFKAQETHRANFPDGDVELATLLSIKTGGCPEDCSYCPQAARYDTDVKAN